LEDFEEKSEPVVDKVVPFEGVKEVDIKLISVPEHFRKTRPSDDKVTKTIEYYKTNGKFDKPVQLLLSDSKYLLKDGYLRYYVAMYEVKDGFRLTFDQLFQRFTEIYWPLVVGYGLHQKVGNESQSYVEQYLLEAASTYSMGLDSNFRDLSKNQQREIVKTVKQKCKVNVVGALYGDTKGIFYSFSRKEEWIEINPLTFYV
jgi:hypothetical protein